MILWWLFACSTGEPPAEQAAQPVIVVVTLDTVAARHLHLYGYDKPTSPTLDALAETATVYDHAYSTCGWTLPSHASLFTGLWPHEHGAHKYRREEDGVRYADHAPLVADRTTLAEHLNADGWATAAFVANAGFLAPEWQLDQGFDTYEAERVPGTAIVERGLSWLRQQDGPAMLFLNVMEAHTPYGCDIPTEVGDRCRLDGTVSMGRHLRKARRRDKVAEFQRAIVADYDGGVAAADAAVGALVAGLKAQGRFDTATLVVTSDHGELHGPHDQYGHGKDVWNPLLHVPLLVKAPGQEDGVRHGGTVSLAHVPHLVLDALGRDTTPFDAHWPPTEAVAQTYYGVTSERRLSEGFDRVRQAVVGPTHKLLASSTGERQLVLREDDEETSDLGLPAKASELEARLQTFEQGAHPGAVEGNTDELRALGYVE
jgi:arylsulfatase A-like enzyme